MWLLPVRLVRVLCLARFPRLAMGVLHLRPSARVWERETGGCGSMPRENWTLLEKAWIQLGSKHSALAGASKRQSTPSAE